MHELRASDGTPIAARVPHAQRQTIKVQTHPVGPKALAALLGEFLGA